MSVKEKVQIILTGEEIANLEMALERSINYYEDMAYDADYYSCDSVKRYEKRIEDIKDILVKVRKQVFETHMKNFVEKRRA